MVSFIFPLIFFSYIKNLNTYICFLQPDIQLCFPVRAVQSPADPIGDVQHPHRKPSSVLTIVRFLLINSPYG